MLFCLPCRAALGPTSVLPATSLLCCGQGDLTSHGPMWPQLLALLAGAPRLHSLHARDSGCLCENTIAAFGGLVPMHLRSLRLHDMLDEV